MQQTCTQCGSAMNTSSRFCTNCGATQAPAQAQAYRQSWEAPPPQNPSQVPPWAQAPGGMYQQQQMSGGYNQDANGALGFGGSNDNQMNNLLKVGGIVLLGGVLLFITCIALAIIIPVPDIQRFLVIVAFLLILIPWIIYRRIRRMIRRTIGGFWRFF